MRQEWVGLGAAVFSGGILRVWFIEDGEGEGGLVVVLVGWLDAPAAEILEFFGERMGGGRK